MLKREQRELDGLAAQVAKQRSELVNLARYLRSDDGKSASPEFVAFEISVACGLLQTAIDGLDQMARR